MTVWRAVGMVAVSLTALVGRAETLSLVEAINHALRYNRGVLAGELAAGEAEIDVAEALGAFAIRWGPEAGITTTADDDGYFAGVQARQRFYTGGEIGARGGFASEGDRDAGYVVLDARQPLFRNAGSLVNRESEVRARQGVLDARRALFLRKMDVMLDVVRGYEAVLRYERQVDMDARALTRLENLAILTRAREDTGGATRLDTLRVELQRGEAEAALENSREVLALERDDFFNLIGWTQSTDRVFVPPPLLDFDPPPLPEALGLAFSNRLDYARALDQLDTAERQILIARQGLLPDLSAVGNYRWRGGQDDRGTWDLAEEAWFAGVTVEPDLNRYSQRAGLGRSISRRDQARIALTDLDYTLERDIKQQTRAYQRAAVNYRIALRNTDLAWKRLELAESMFRMGRGDNFSVTDAEAAHAAAVTSELAARAEASLSGYRLLYVLGRLLDTPHELKPTW
ncbi:MAG TPA: TolC family protein [Kiritimatiellia bacterium]|nr:TolC family protein [Kiritimatiellia bacterium]HMO99715.1 TolC family protein [Kiritimatiellia bacterium]HMP97058.1 TolC family protein [Kiritimatiellia bacterium]